VELSLAEEVALVAYDPVRRRLPQATDSRLTYSFAGAVVAELLLRGAATIQDGRLEGGSETGDPVLDAALVRIRSSRRSRTIEHWVRALPSRSFPLRKRLLERLVAAGILEPSRERLLGLFTVERFVLRDEQSRADLLSAVRQALTGESTAQGDRMAALIGLLSTAGLVDRVVERGERAAARRRARVVAGHDAGSRAVARALADTQAAVMAAVTAAVAATAVSDGGGGHGH